MDHNRRVIDIIHHQFKAGGDLNVGGVRRTNGDIQRTNIGIARRTNKDAGCRIKRQPMGQITAIGPSGRQHKFIANIRILEGIGGQSKNKPFILQSMVRCRNTLGRWGRIGRGYGQVKNGGRCQRCPRTVIGRNNLDTDGLQGGWNGGRAKRLCCTIKTQPAW